MLQFSFQIKILNSKWSTEHVQAGCWGGTHVEWHLAGWAGLLGRWCHWPARHACGWSRNRPEIHHLIVFKGGCYCSPIRCKGLEYTKWNLNVPVVNETSGNTMLFITKWPNFAIKSISWDFKTHCACAEMISVLHAFCFFYRSFKVFKHHLKTCLYF